MTEMAATADMKGELDIGTKKGTAEVGSGAGAGADGTTGGDSWHNSCYYCTAL